LRSTRAVAFWEGTCASRASLVLLPVLALFFMAPIFLRGYVLDAPAICIPVAFAALQRTQLRKAAGSLPAFFVLRVVNGLFLLEALWNELLVGRPLLVYEKGH